ncbi:MAG: phosphatase [Bacteroidetes bacterium HGW-Bacteroidetes-8]|jgi:exopolyphosphatase/guanosine-5'-triphosphate,3'-diphosphate pyrophosphatase|nr:MAG: phosphatase [Bacteroidetes bacterium HGW-Bacteroidetes-8]
MRLAVFDLGTNVFNLLLARISKGECDIKKVIKMGSHIGRDGFIRGELSRESIESSIGVLDDMFAQIKIFGGVDKVKAFATSAIRDASNGEQFAQMLRERYSMDVEIISGEREAELIYKGIRESILLYNEKVLMLDIGGGSNEFIIADRDTIYWKESYPLGVIRMREIINPSDPITEEEINKYTNYLDKALKTLFEQVEIYKPTLLIGSSGSFDTLRELIFKDDDGSLPAMELPVDMFLALHQKLLESTRDERLSMAGMSPMRVDYMVLGSIFVEYTIRKIGIKELYQSSFSLKEGYMAETASSIGVYE